MDMGCRYCVVALVAEQERDNSDQSFRGCGTYGRRVVV